MDKYTGKRLDGRYEIHELVGVGGMAVVYRAYDTIDDRAVAVKILKDEFLGNEEFIRRFKNESKAIAVLSHPNISTSKSGLNGKKPSISPFRFCALCSTRMKKGLSTATLSRRTSCCSRMEPLKSPISESPVFPAARPAL